MSDLQKAHDNLAKAESKVREAEEGMQEARIEAANEKTIGRWKKGRRPHGLDTVLVKDDDGIVREMVGSYWAEHSERLEEEGWELVEAGEDEDEGEDGEEEEEEEDE